MSRTVPLLHRVEDPATSSDPRVRSVVEKLGAVHYAPAPRPEFRDELRAQLVAIASRVVSEGDISDGAVTEGASRDPATVDPIAATRAASTDDVTTLARPATSASRRRSHARRVGRPLGLAAACCAVLALGLGGAVWKSRSALPGDSLYGLKRTSENVQLSLTSGRTARSHEYLELASTRVQEAQDLLGQDSALASGSGTQASGLSPTTVSLIRSTLGSANTDVTSGTQLLHSAALASPSADPWSIMIGWAPGQITQLEHLKAAIGNGPAATSAQQSTRLVRKALGQAREQQARAKTPKHGSSPSSTTTTSPAERSTAASRHVNAHARSTAPTAGATHHPSTHGSSTPTSGPTHSTEHHPKGTTSSTPPSGLLPTKIPTKIPTKVPTVVPTLVPSVGVGINSCGISVGLGGIISITTGSCSTGS